MRRLLEIIFMVIMAILFIIFLWIPDLFWSSEEYAEVALPISLGIAVIIGLIYLIDQLFYSGKPIRKTISKWLEWIIIGIILLSIPIAGMILNWWVSLKPENDYTGGSIILLILAFPGVLILAGLIWLHDKLGK